MLAFVSASFSNAALDFRSKLSGLRLACFRVAGDFQLPHCFRRATCDLTPSVPGPNCGEGSREWSHCFDPCH